ncbi:MAG TPA: ABC transporter ATP-binding protein [Desulfonatronum sp.]|nr:ABC transporter ATP-binding protein [Desulfonatronum sp.]
MALIQLNDVSKSYQVGQISQPALRNVSVDIETGGLVTFVGPSGSGKTTLLNLIGCMDRPSSGRITVDGKRVDNLGRKASAAFRGAHLGFIFQSFNLLPVLTVYENVEYPLLMIRRAPADQRQERVLRILEAVDMAGQKDKLPDQISGGQKQRVAVARALVTQPKVILADEPTANLDTETAKKIIALMREMRDAFGTTFVFSTHDPRIVEQADVVHTIVDGRLVSDSDFALHKSSGGADHA